MGKQEILPVLEILEDKTQPAFTRCKNQTFLHLPAFCLLDKPVSQPVLFHSQSGASWRKYFESFSGGLGAQVPKCCPCAPSSHLCRVHRAGLFLDCLWKRLQVFLEKKTVGGTSASRIPNLHKPQGTCHGSDDGIREYIACSREAGKPSGNANHFCPCYGSK